MIMKKKAELGLILIGCILIIACGYFIVKQGLVSNNNSTEKVGIYVDGTFEEVPDLELPIDITEAETIVKKFCESENPDNAYGYNAIKKVNGKWRIPIVNLNCLCAAVVNVETGETNCTECHCNGLYPPFGGVTITTDKTEYERGDTVEITVENNLDKSIWYYGKPSFGCSNAFDIGDKEFYSLGTSWCISPVSELKPKSEQVFDLELSGDFNQWLKIYDVYDIKLPEDFKLRFNYGFNKENPAEEKIYSNKFTIKEKSALDLRCSEKVKIIGDCDAEVQGYEFNLDTEKCIAVDGSGCSVEGPFKTLEECQEICEKKEADDTYKIYMKSRQFIPKPGISDALNSAIATTSYEQMHVLLQFYHLPGNDERSKLSGLNVTLCGYIHNNAYLTSIPTGYLTEISNLSFIRWIGDILPEDKISSYIRDDKIGNWAVNEDGTVNVIVKFFKDVLPEDAKNVIEQHDGTAKSGVGMLNDLTISISKDRITDLAKEDSVQWIEQVSPPATTDDINSAE